MDKKKLKELAVAYQLALEFDYCPDREEIDEAKDIHQGVTVDILDEYCGDSSYEIMNLIIREIEKESEGA